MTKRQLEKHRREGKLTDGYNCPLALFGDDFELEMELDTKPSIEITPPIPFVSGSINVSESIDFLKKACTYAVGATFKTTYNLFTLIKDR